MAGLGPLTAVDASPSAGSRPWEAAGAEGEQYRWEDEVRRSFHMLRGWTIGSLPDLAPSLAKVGGRLGTRWVSDEAVARAGQDMLAAALGLALMRAGWAIEAAPSAQAVLRKGDRTIDPAAEIGHLVDGSIDAAGWRARWSGLGLASLRLDALRRAA
jgi:hypothetical protein